MKLWRRMGMESNRVINGVTLDNKKLRRMLFQIVFIERKNSKTKQFSDSEMVNKVQKIIEEELECL